MFIKWLALKNDNKPLLTAMDIHSLATPAFVGWVQEIIIGYLLKA